MKIRSLSAGALAAFLTVAIPGGGAWAAHRSDAEKAIAQAKALQDQAAAAGIDTTHSARLIEEAQGLLPSRQYTKAMELVEKAMKQDRFALGQAAGKGAETGPGKAGAAGATAAAVAPADSAAATEAQQAIAAAEQARKQAAAVGGEWRDTANMIEEAGELAKSGDYAAAVKLANSAKRQGELGYAQALAEKDAGFPAYMSQKKN